MENITLEQMELKTGDKITQADLAKVDNNTTKIETTVNEHTSSISDIKTSVLESTGYGIISGGEVSAQSTPNMTVSVSSGKIKMSDGTEVNVSGASSLTISNVSIVNGNRKDIIYADATGTINYLEGTILAVSGSKSYTITTNFIAGDKITFDKIVFTATTSTQDTTNFIVGSDIATSATNLANAINANATTGAVYKATASSGVVTIAEIVSGTGNTPDSMTVSGTGVVADGTVTFSTPATIPSTPSSGILLGIVKVGYSTTAIKKSNIIDMRNMIKTNTSLSQQLSHIVTVNVKDYGAVGDGVTDDSQAFLNAISECISHVSALVLVPEGHYIITQPLTFYCDIMTIEGYGAKLDFSHLSSGSTAIKIITSVNPTATDSNSEYSNNIRKGQIHYAKGLYIQGNKYITGLNFDAGSGNYISEGFNFEHCAITGFNLAVRIYSNAWVNTFHYCNISNNNIAVNMPKDGANYAERITFIGSNLHSNLQTFLINNSNGHFHLIGCSLDYNYQYAYVQNGRIYLTNCHIESTRDTDYYFYAIGSNSSIFMKNCEFYLGKVNYAVGYVENGGTIDIDSGFINYTTYSVGKLVDGYGNVSTRLIGDSFGNAGADYKGLNFPPTVSSSTTSYSVSDSTDIVIPYKLQTANGDICFVTYTIDGTTYSTTIAQRGYNYFRIGYLAIGSHTVTIQAVSKTGTKSNILTVIETVTATTSGTTIVSDTFNRADNPYLGTPTTGESWNTILGTANIASQKAKFTAFGNGSIGVALTNSITPNYAINCDITWNNGVDGLIFRSDHIGGLFYVLLITSSKIVIRQNTSGIYGTVITSTVNGATDYIFTPVVGTTYTLKVTCNGGTVTCYLNGTNIITFTDSSLTSNHFAGIYSYNDSVSTFDNFSVIAN